MAEGKAVIVKVYKPVNFTPNTSFRMFMRVNNNGGDDTLFARVTNIDTGEIVGAERAIYVLSGNGADFDFVVTLTQTTDFHGRAEAGHIA